MLANLHSSSMKIVVVYIEIVKCPVKSVANDHISQPPAASYAVQRQLSEQEAGASPPALRFLSHPPQILFRCILAIS